VQDAISSLIGRYDQQGRYFDGSALDRLENYFSESELRIAAVDLINGDAAEIVREASQRLWLSDPELLLPGGNAYTTRRLSACLRDLDYFLRYASYALVAADWQVLDERVLNGLNDTYKSLGVPTGPTAKGILLMAEVLTERLSAVGYSSCSLVRAPFEHMARALSEISLNGL
jgi:phycobilisome core component